MMPHRRLHRAGVVALLIPALVAAAQAQATASRTRVVMLGTGNPAPDPERFGPATAILVDSTAYLVDAGVGVMRRWNAARARQLVDGALWKRVVFVTHLHSDHTLGLPEVILTMWMQNPRREVVLYGPKGLQAMTTHILAAWSEDVRIRTAASGEMGGAPAPRVIVHEIGPGEVYRDSLVTVTAFLVHHGSWPQAFGYRFNTPDKVVVLSGDAGPPSAIPDQCHGCDILIHEGGLPAAAATPYFKDFHTTAEELAAIANQSRPGLLVLTHQRAGINERGLAIIRAQYDGKVVIASDLDVFP
jgi:ribonuclease BN (tRNA processing enzyme)